MARIIEVKVKPNARASSLEQQEDGSWLAQLKAPPVDGKANAELVALLAKAFGCHKADISIKTGAGSRTKRITINSGAEKQKAPRRSTCGKRD